MGAMDTPKQVDCHIFMSTMCLPIHMRERTLYSSYRLLGIYHFSPFGEYYRSIDL